MLELRWDSDCAPKYMTTHSSNCDLKARVTTVVPANKVAAVPAGVWIVGNDDSAASGDTVPELQIRCRSSLAAKHGIMLANGVGTIDADYRDEINVLLWNSTGRDFLIEKGDRIAQMCMTLVYRIPSVEISQDIRKGGFGSTNHRQISDHV